MATAKLIVKPDELSNEKIMALLDEAEVPAERGPEGMNNVMVDMGGLMFLIDSLPQQGLIKIWTARNLDHEAVSLEAAIAAANSFNQVFLFVRNFVFQDPADPANFRTIWDHDRMVTPEGLSADELAMTLARVAEVVFEALSHNESQADA
jgi:hypothetical protein